MEYQIYDVSVFFFKQKTAYEITASDWSSDVCSSDLMVRLFIDAGREAGVRPGDIVGAIAGEADKIGRASCRERVFAVVYISVVGVSLKKKKKEEIEGGLIRCDEYCDNEEESWW